MSIKIPKWEYKRIESKSDLCTYYNEEGQKGWELISEGTGIIFKRQCGWIELKTDEDIEAEKASKPVDLTANQFKW